MNRATRCALLASVAVVSPACSDNSSFPEVFEEPITRPIVAVEDGQRVGTVRVVRISDDTVRVSVSASRRLDGATPWLEHVAPCDNPQVLGGWADEPLRNGRATFVAGVVTDLDGPWGLAVRREGGGFNVACAKLG
jgi:hypothetical protein